MSAEKCPSIFLHNVEAFVYILYLAVLLQGIGLSLEEALIFWRAEFTKLMDVDKVFTINLHCQTFNQRNSISSEEHNFLTLRLMCLCSYGITWPII